MSFDVALDRLVQTMRGQRRSPSTVYEYARVLRRLHAAYDLEQSAAAFAAWHAEAVRRFEREEISASKVRNEHVALRVFFDAAGVRPNPARGARVLPRGEWEPRPIPLSDIAKLMDAVPLRDAAGYLDPDGLRDRAILECTYNGLRRVEICRLTTEHVVYSAEERTIVLRVLGKATRGHPGGKWREVPLAPHSAEVLAWYLLVLHVRLADRNAWLREFQAQLAARKEDPALAPLLAVDRLVRKRLQGEPPQPLFGVQSLRMIDGQWSPAHRRMEGGTWRDARWPLRGRMVDEIFAKYRDRAGLPAKYGPHALRHSCATELLRQKVDIRKIGEILGHSSPMVTQLYTKVVLDIKAEAMRSLPSAGRRVS